MDIPAVIDPVQARSITAGGFRAPRNCEYKF